MMSSVERYIDWSRLSPAGTCWAFRKEVLTGQGGPDQPAWGLRGEL